MKLHRCQTCGQKRHNRDFRVVINPFTRKPVRICTDRFSCQIPFMKKRTADVGASTILG